LNFVVQTVSEVRFNLRRFIQKNLRMLQKKLEKYLKLL